MILSFRNEKILTLLFLKEAAVVKYVVSLDTHMHGTHILERGPLQHGS